MPRLQLLRAVSASQHPNSTGPLRLMRALVKSQLGSKLSGLGLANEVWVQALR